LHRLGPVTVVALQRSPRPEQLLEHIRRLRRKQLFHVRLRAMKQTWNGRAARHCRMRTLQPSDHRLPQFRNQPDMNGREAASVLSAVENMERQQRRDQAAKRARQRSAKGKDW